MAKSSSPKTIALFDSGVGGLTVLRALVRLLPRERYLYFGDTARLPYGSKSAATVARYAISAAHFLEQQGAELLVIACNTATALAFPEIKKAVGVPLIGVVEPGAEAVAAATKTRRAAVIATEATIASHAYHKALAARGIEIVEKACPLLVPLVEEGWAEHPVTREVAQIYLQEIFADGRARADVLLLGCTHYPLLHSVLRRLTPESVSIVDSAESTARAVAKMIGVTPADKNSSRAPNADAIRFFATDSAEKFRMLGERFLGQTIRTVEHVDLENL